MATQASISQTNGLKSEVQDKPVGLRRFDLISALLALWIIIGLGLDGWAHAHIPRLETFFTPWHGVLYSGFLASAAFLVANALRNRSQGSSWRKSVPTGYWLSLIGVPIFLFGGVADMIGHILWGIEVGVEPLLSPTHLILAVGGLLMISGPLRAAWQRREGKAPGWLALFPMLLSVTLSLSIVTFFTQFSNPNVNVFLVTASDSKQWINQALGTTGMLFLSVVLVCVVYMLVRRWTLPRGSLIFVIGLNTLYMALIYERYALIISGFLAGLAVELIYWWLNPTVAKAGTMRLFLPAVPVSYFVMYFMTVQVWQGLRWSIYLWGGVTVLSGIIGYLLSLMFMPPAIPDGETSVS
jgi:hypothetical protein